MAWWWRWLPWRLFLSHVAKTRGFIDPVAVMSRLHRFMQPSEITEPIELLRAGMVFHARGLINTRAIQHNLDWVWPYWVERQFDPEDVAFVPRAFSITHVNLTHRNWTAAGLPNLDWLPIVDPAGLLTPQLDGWSLDCWIVSDSAEVAPLLPSRCKALRQRQILEPGPAIVTDCEQNGMMLSSRVEVVRGEDGVARCRLRLTGSSPLPAWLVVSVRPANPEGVSFVHKVAVGDDPRSLRVNEQSDVWFDREPQRVCMSTYHGADVLANLAARLPRKEITCDVGMATAAAMFRMEADRPVELTVQVPYELEPAIGPAGDAGTWEEALADRCELQAPDARFCFLFDAAVRSLILHSPGVVYPGPYTYRRFWYRDATMIVNGLLAANLIERARRALSRFPDGQTARGYFHSQEGEWDSNGQALWIFDRFRRWTGGSLPKDWLDAMERGARWIRNRRTSDELSAAHAGLLPAGFSAEHLGPNDFYYWDDFWSAAGLFAAADTFDGVHRPAVARDARFVARALLTAVDRSLDRRATLRQRDGVPASPYRRMDSGAVGSLAVGYPLCLWPAKDPRLLDTVDFLLQKCTVRHGFFQDMIHSGINAYLTLHMAQVLLRAEDERFLPLVEAVAELASPTGQWPEAIHPHTGGGCMGDGQHIWAAAEWVLMVRSMFVREEGERLILGSGLPRPWLVSGETLRLGPTPTNWGTITVQVDPDDEGGWTVRWEASWRGPAPVIEIRLPGTNARTADRGDNSCRVSRPMAAVNTEVMRRLADAETRQRR